jgi:PHP family Zn ribbon phosphoesterase
MKNDNREHGETKKLTPASLQNLRKKGFRYVQVQGFSPDKHLDYMEPRYFLLVPLKNLPTEADQKGIYEPIESEILNEWANTAGEGFEVLIAAAE